MPHEKGQKPLIRETFHRNHQPPKPADGSALNEADFSSVDPPNFSAGPAPRQEAVKRKRKINPNFASEVRRSSKEAPLSNSAPGKQRTSKDSHSPNPVIRRSSKERGQAPPKGKATASNQHLRHAMAEAKQTADAQAHGQDQADDSDGVDVDSVGVNVEDSDGSDEMVRVARIAPAHAPGHAQVIPAKRRAVAKSSDAGAGSGMTSSSKSVSAARGSSSRV